MLEKAIEHFGIEPLGSAGPLFAGLLSAPRAFDPRALPAAGSARSLSAAQAAADEARAARAAARQEVEFVQPARAAAAGAAQ